MELVVQRIGLIVAASFILFSIDDLIWDIVNIVRIIRFGKPDRLPIEQLDAVPPKLLAVMIAAWREENVIEDVVENVLASLQYPQSMYHVFIGVYPNDGATIGVVAKLEAAHANVHMVVNAHPGPTCKADNVNNIIRFIKQFESERGWRFSSVTIHDSEDVVHPYELKLTSYLLDFYDLLQFPVIPLQKMPTLKTAFEQMTIGTYADEFAENHYRTMGSREAMSAVVPSAGTGYVLSHAILDSFGDAPIFPEDSLTEDYKLSLILAKQGFLTHFVLEKLPRLMDSGQVRWDYVATRSFFPDTFKAAVRQKTRWIYGITMQSAKISEIFRRSKMGFASRYSLYKDLKAKLSNLVVLPGYLVFIYFIASLFLGIPVMYPKHTLAYALCLFLTFMMLFRQLMRAVAITNFYGLKSMAVSCLLPPLMPIRLVWGNIINMTATFKAWKLFFFGTGTKKKPKKVAWNKTNHTFLHKSVLFRYYRNVGDILLEKQYVDVHSLNRALNTSREEGARIGEVLLRQGLITEAQLAEAIAGVQHRPFVNDISLYPGKLAAAFDQASLERLIAFPILHTAAGYVLAVAAFSDLKAIPAALGLDPAACSFVYTTKGGILATLGGKTEGTAVYRAIAGYLEAGVITWEQAVLAIDRYASTPDILSHMGLRPALGVEAHAAPQEAPIPARQSRAVNFY
ncbi:MAG: glycosyltransferase [Candidatus Pelethousia sp.]|nr:glycosyltransferase [Candidatus Pelethousia sp.]